MGDLDDFADALEQLAIESLTLAAQHSRTLDDLEDDLFRFARVIAGQTGLRYGADRATCAAREGQPALRAC